MYTLQRLRSLMLAFIATAFASASHAGSALEYNLQTDVVYGQGAVLQNGQAVERDLLLDIYSPVQTDDTSLRPAAVLVHGGAYHRGGRRLPPFREAGAVHSPMEDYARLLAPLGYVCFVIEYRLAPESPQPQTQPGTLNLLAIGEEIHPAGLARLNFARRQMGLPDLDKGDSRLLWNAAMAGAEDTLKAVEFVRHKAATYNIDPDKIALGGHSAGGANTLNAAFGLRAPVAAIFPLSPPGMLFDQAEVMAGEDLPATLLVIAQNDLPAILLPAPGTIHHLQASGVAHRVAWVPGFPHFYPTGAVSLADDGTRMSVGERVAGFLNEHLGMPDDDARPRK